MKKIIIRKGYGNLFLSYEKNRPLVEELTA